MISDSLAEELRAELSKARAEIERLNLVEALKEQPITERMGTGMSEIKRFTAYRLDMDSRDTHTELQKNPEDEAQYEGVIWSDGTVTLRWLTALRSHSVWDSLADCLGVHGHPEYGTRIIWHDHSEPPAEWISQCQASVETI